MLIPEIIINNILNSILEVVNDDWNSNVDKTKTILYEAFNKDDNGDIMKIGKFNYFDQAKDIFIKDKGDVRMLQITLGYNLERAPLPTIHIILPSESKENNGIGFNEGYEDTKEDENDGTYKQVYTYGTQSTYNLLVTSSNSSEAILIYHFFKYCLISIKDHIEDCGLQNISFGGNDLNFQGDMVPTTVFHRSLLFNFFYYSDSTNLFKKKFITGITFTPDVVELDPSIKIKK